MIEDTKYNELNDKYNRLLSENLKAHNLLDLIATHVKHLIFDKEKGILYFSQAGKYFYLNTNKNDVCMVCGKAKKTTAHHLVPLRASCKNKILKELRIRVCKSCDKKVHPEHKSFAKKVMKNLLKTKDTWKDKLKELKKENGIIKKKLNAYKKFKGATPGEIITKEQLWKLINGGITCYETDKKQPITLRDSLTKRIVGQIWGYINNGKVKANEPVVEIK